MRRQRPPCIPGLVRQAFTKGSRHNAACPELVSSEVNEETGHCSFTWRARGSNNSTYDIEAFGKLTLELDTSSTGDENTSTDDDEHDVTDTDNIQVVGRGLEVTCSCPDGQRQKVASLSRNKIIVCKHAAAALESVLDADAKRRYNDEVASLRREEAQKAQRVAEAAKEQNREMPGERERIEHGLVAMTSEAIQAALKESCKTVEGLRALTQIFPQSVMPAPQMQFCERCKQDYDEQYPEQRICRLEHPPDFCHTEWDGSKVKWEHCYRCNQDFDVPEWYRRRRNCEAPFDAGRWCFEGEHTQDEDKVSQEKWDADPADIVG